MVRWHRLVTRWHVRVALDADVLQVDVGLAFVPKFVAVVVDLDDGDDHALDRHGDGEGANNDHKNDHGAEHPPRQQWIYASRVNDGIVDCPDGSDEYAHEAAASSLPPPPVDGPPPDEEEDQQQDDDNLYRRWDREED